MPPKSTRSSKKVVTSSPAVAASSPNKLRLSLQEVVAIAKASQAHANNVDSVTSVQLAAPITLSTAPVTPPEVSSSNKSKAVPPTPTPRAKRKKAPSPELSDTDSIEVVEVKKRGYKPKKPKIIKDEPIDTEVASAMLSMVVSGDSNSSRKRVPTEKAKAILKQHGLDDQSSPKLSSFHSSVVLSDDESLPPGPVSTEHNADDVECQEVADSNAEEAGSQDLASEQDDGTGTGPEETSTEGPEDPHAVMQSGLQDKLLTEAGHYDRLPPLGPARAVLGFQMAVQSECNFEQAIAHFGLIAEHLSEAEQLALIVALGFNQSGQFINTARASPSLLNYDNEKLKWAGKNQVAIGIMLGVISECNIITPDMTGNPRYPYLAKFVTIIPFPQEMRRDMTVWGQVMGFESIQGTLSDKGIRFQSLPAGKGIPGNNSGSIVAPSTPQRSKSRFSTTIKSAVKFKLPANSTLPVQRNFEDDIPIFDGRAAGDRPAFAFTDSDFDRLQDLPRYKGSNGQPADLPADAVVAIGYSLHTYASKTGRSARHLSTNLIFVILLAIPS